MPGQAYCRPSFCIPRSRPPFVHRKKLAVPSFKILHILVLNRLHSCDTYVIIRLIRQTSRTSVMLCKREPFRGYRRFPRSPLCGADEWRHYVLRQFTSLSQLGTRRALRELDRNQNLDLSGCEVDDAEQAALSCDGLCDRARCTVPYATSASQLAEARSSRCRQQPYRWVGIQTLASSEPRPAGAKPKKPVATNSNAKRKVQMTISIISSQYEYLPSP